MLWPTVHYASGFGALEAMVLRSTTPVSPEVASRSWRETRPYAIHAVLLVVGLLALLAIGLPPRRVNQIDETTNVGYCQPPRPWFIAYPNATCASGSANPSEPRRRSDRTRAGSDRADARAS